MLYKIKNYLWEDKFYILSIIILILLFNIKLPYYVNAPGGVIDIKNRIVYEEKENYEGSLNMLYVKEYVASIPFYLLSYIVPDWDLESISDSQVSSNETVDEINTRSKVMLDNSINNAMYVAYKAANKDVKIKNMKYIVIGVTKENGLKIGDEILKIENTEVDSLDTIKNIINEKNIGDKITLVIKRDNQEKTITSKIKKISGEKALGVVISTNYELETDPKIELKFKSSESGSSGGLMMTLSIYSAISGEDILKGRNIAGTGTIDMNGNVGEIGGIKYKIMGAVKNNMDIVLVPSANYKEAMKVKKEKNYHIKIVKVDTFNEALEYLRDN